MRAWSSSACARVCAWERAKESERERVRQWEGTRQTINSFASSKQALNHNHVSAVHKQGCARSLELLHTFTQGSWPFTSSHAAIPSTHWLTCLQGDTSHTLPLPPKQLPAALFTSHLHMEIALPHVTVTTASWALSALPALRRTNAHKHTPTHTYTLLIFAGFDMRHHSSWGAIIILLRTERWA